MYNCLLDSSDSGIFKRKGKNMVNSDKIIDMKEIYKNVYICLIKPET